MTKRKKTGNHAGRALNLRKKKQKEKKLIETESEIERRREK